MSNSNSNLVVQGTTDSFVPSSFIQNIISVYHKNGLVGEDRNIAKVFLAAISKYLPAQYRIHIIVFSQSSAGKTTLLKTVTEPFKEHVHNYSRFTGAGIDRREESFDGKIILYEQLNGFESSSLKLLLSEGELTILVADRGADNRIKSVEKRLEGMPVFMTTSTAQIDDELLNRVMPLSMDESEEQTKAIIQKQAENFTIIGSNDSITKWSEIDQIKSCYEKIRPSTIFSIAIPFAKNLVSDLPLPLTIRRDLKRLFKLVQIIAYAKHIDAKSDEYQRPIIELSQVKGVSKKVIVALPEDLHDALWCFGENLAESFYQVFGRAKEVYSALCEFSKEKTDEGATVRDITNNLKGLKQKSVYSYLEMLCNSDLATKDKAGNKNIYFPTNNEFQKIDMNATFTPEDFDKWLTSQMKDRSYTVTVTNDMFNTFAEVEQSIHSKSLILDQNNDESKRFEPNIKESEDTRLLPPL